MKVVFIAPRPFGLAFGGQEVQLLETARALGRLGVEVELLRPFDREQLADVDLVHLFGCDHVHLQASKLLAARGVPQVISPVFYKAGPGLLVWAALARAPYSQANLTRQLLARAACVLPNSRAEARQLARTFGVPTARMLVVPNAVDPERVGRDPGGFRERHLGDWGDVPFVLSAGRIERRKNSLLLLRAAQAAQLPIVFLGDRVPAEEEYARAFQRALDDHPQARALPAVPHGSDALADAFAACHAHALVSRVETPGLANLEAALHGANLVVGESAPVREYLSGHAHFVLPRLKLVAAALERALVEPRNALGQRELIIERYTWGETARRTLAAYEGALAGR